MAWPMKVPRYNPGDLSLISRHKKRLYWEISSVYLSTETEANQIKINNAPHGRGHREKESGRSWHPASISIKKADKRLAEIHYPTACPSGRQWGYEDSWSMINTTSETETGLQPEDPKSKAARYWLLPQPQYKMAILPSGISEWDCV